MEEYSKIIIFIHFYSIPFPHPKRGFNEFFTKTLKIPLYIQPFILKYGSNSNIIIK